MTKEQLMTEEAFFKLKARRSLMRNAGKAALNAVKVSLPFSAIFFSKELNAGINNSLISSLNFLLQIEYAQLEFYKKATASAAFNPEFSLIFNQIIQQQASHIRFFETQLGPDKAIPPVFDFTGSKNFTITPLFPDVFEKIDTLLIVAQALEDAGVKGYKDIIGSITDKRLLSILLRMHSVECRHSAMLRILKNYNITTKLRVSQSGWTIPTEKNINSNIAEIYINEDSKLQSNITLTNISSLKNLSPIIINEAFDEPLEVEKTSSFLKKFIY